MKIVYLCSDPDIQVLGHEGCSVHVREFTNALSDAGHDVLVLCAWAGGVGDAQLRAGLRVLEPAGLEARAWELVAREPVVQTHHLERDLKSLMWNQWLQTAGAELVRGHRPDFIYERYALFGWGGVELSRALSVPLILELNAPLCQQQAGYEKFVLTQTAAGLERDILGSADAMVALTPWLKRWAVAQGAAGDRIHVLPDAVSERLFRETPSGDDVRRQYGLNGHRVVGFVGSFHWWHDVKGLLGAFARLYDRDRDLRLLLVGGGDRRQTLEQTARARGLGDAVLFTGKVPHERVPSLLAAMDLCVVPYVPLDDFFFSPLKLVECMAAGRPTVASAQGQIAEIVEHGVNGWLYPAGDETALATCMSEVLADPDRAAAAGREARRRILEHHTWTAVADRVVGIAESLIAAQWIHR